MAKPSDEIPSDRAAVAWSVLRQDDNGNRFVMHVGLTREEAERLVAHYESLGHKQLYWAEPSDSEAKP
jgi:hypothetical protein